MISELQVSAKLMRQIESHTHNSPNISLIWELRCVWVVAVSRRRQQEQVFLLTAYCYIAHPHVLVHVEVLKT